jgi:Secretion system C-terminal sorting domain
MKATVQVVPKSAIRMPLHEVFTSSTCPPCNPGNVQLQNIFDANPDKYTCVKYQEHWPEPGDPYYTQEVEDRATYYGAISGVPDMFIDGGWGSGPGSYTQAIFDQYYEIPSFIDIEAKYNIMPYQYDVTDTTVKIDVTITPYANFIGYTPKLYLAIVERVTTRNAKSNGETEFYYVLKKMVPNATGTTLSKLEKDKPQTISKSYTFRGKYKLPPDANSPINLFTQNSVEDYNNLLVVAWIQDDNTRNILQSTWGRFPTSIRDNNPNSIIRGFFPNPVNDQATVKFRLEKPESVSFEVMNMLGQSSIVLPQLNYQPGDQQVTLPLSGLEPGAYFLLIKTTSGVSSVRFIK